MDLRNPKWMYIKAALFVLIGAACFALVWIENPKWTTALYLALMVWAFARAYYFAFYVVENYVDGEFRFAGLIDFARYLWRRRK